MHENDQDAITGERLELRYIPLDRALAWSANPKLHDLPAIKESIRRYGFKDPPKFEPILNNGHGGLVEGNGRLEATAEMRDDGEDLPRGCGMDAQGRWYIPVVFGVDADSLAAATAYAVDHNWLTVAPLGAAATAGIWSESMMVALAPTLAAAPPVALKGANLIEVLAGAGESGEEEGQERSTGEETVKLRLTLAEPETACEAGEVWELGGRHVLVICDVVTEVPVWLPRLLTMDGGETALFCPYPDPFAAIGLQAQEARMFLLQPDAYLAGHLLDQYRAIHGEGSVERVHQPA